MKLDNLMFDRLNSTETKQVFAKAKPLKSCCDCTGKCGKKCACMNSKMEKCAKSCDSCDVKQKTKSAMVEEMIQDLVRISALQDELGFEKSAGLTLASLQALAEPFDHLGDHSDVVGDLTGDDTVESFLAGDLDDLSSQFHSESGDLKVKLDDEMMDPGGASELDMDVLKEKLSDPSHEVSLPSDSNLDELLDAELDAELSGSDYVDSELLEAHAQLDGLLKRAQDSDGDFGHIMSLDPEEHAEKFRALEDYESWSPEMAAKEDSEFSDYADVPVEGDWDSFEEDDLFPDDLLESDLLKSDDDSYWEEDV